MRIAPTVVRSFAALPVVALLVFGTPTDASAIDITKSYNFGPGTGTHTARGTFRDFSIPCGTTGSIVVTITFRRLGPTGSANDFLIDFEIHEPATGQETEGRITSGGAFNTGVTANMRTISITTKPTSGGCTKPWVVRIKSDDGAVPPYAVEGSILLGYSGATRNLSIPAMTNSYLKIGESKTLLIEGTAGCGQGRMVITGTWNHTIGVVPGPLPVKLKFELMNSSYAFGGAVIAEASGYSNNELRGELAKLRLVHQVPDCRGGQWKLRITNIDAHDAFLNLPSVKLTPTCP